MNDPQAVIVGLRKMLVVKEREAADLQDRVQELTAQLQSRPPRSPHQHRTIPTSSP